MSSYHLLTKRAYAPPANPYGAVSPTPSMGAPEWQSAPGLQTPAGPGLGATIWRNKATIGGTVAGGSLGWGGGAAAGAAIGGLFGGVGAIPGAAIGSVIGGLGGSMLGSSAGEAVGAKADGYMNAGADKGQLYRPPVTDMASYGANMLAQGIEQNRARPGQPT